MYQVFEEVGEIRFVAEPEEEKETEQRGEAVSNVQRGKVKRYGFDL